MFDGYWNFLEQNRNKLDDAEHLRKEMIKRFLSKSKTVERVGKAFAQLIAADMRDGFECCYKMK